MRGIDLNFSGEVNVAGGLIYKEETASVLAVREVPGIDDDRFDWWLVGAGFHADSHPPGSVKYLDAVVLQYEIERVTGIAPVIGDRLLHLVNLDSPEHPYRTHWIREIKNPGDYSGIPDLSVMTQSREREYSPNVAFVPLAASRDDKFSMRDLYGKIAVAHMLEQVLLRPSDERFELHASHRLGVRYTDKDEAATETSMSGGTGNYDE